MKRVSRLRDLNAPALRARFTESAEKLEHLVVDFVSMHPRPAPPNLRESGHAEKSIRNLRSIRN